MNVIVQTKILLNGYKLLRSIISFLTSPRRNWKCTFLTTTNRTRFIKANGMSCEETKREVVFAPFEVDWLQGKISVFLKCSIFFRML